MFREWALQVPHCAECSSIRMWWWALQFVQIIWRGGRVSDPLYYFCSIFFMSSVVYDCRKLDKAFIPSMRLITTVTCCTASRIPDTSHLPWLRQGFHLLINVFLIKLYASGVWSPCASCFKIASRSLLDPSQLWLDWSHETFI